MREVYRVETADGHGPYSCGEITGVRFEDAMRSLGKDHDLNWRHPLASPQFLSGAALYGFRSMEDLRRWFDYFGQFGYDLLRDNGFRISVYRVEDEAVEDRDKQVMFERANAYLSRVEEIPDVSEPHTGV